MSRGDGRHKIIPGLFLLFLCNLPALASDQNLPSFGDSMSGIISLEQERQLGQQFLRSIRAGTPLLNDPVLQDYLEHLIYKLAENSQLTDRHLNLVLINNPALNAFAAPGGVVGVHHGLFNHAETEHEISAILSHELAHLSQRHFARNLTESKVSGAINMAGLISGIILAATGGGEAALAALAGTRGYTQHELLRYSREREAEADRVGISTLADAGMDPRAMAHMFERLQKASRYSSGNRIPEFLRTHPVTRSRIADSYNQAGKYPEKNWSPSLEYQLMRVRARILTTDKLQDEIFRLEAGMSTSNEVQRTTNLYGLVLARIRTLEYDAAKASVAKLRRQYPLNNAFRIAEADIHKRSGQLEKSLELLKSALEFSPGNYPLSVKYAETLLAASKPQTALRQLEAVRLDRPDDQQVWYLLAEAYGLANNIPGVHEARAEFFVLSGNFDQAIKHLGYALPLVRDNFQKSERIQKRLDDIKTMQKEN